jgi:hypothetical protein
MAMAQSSQHTKPEVKGSKLSTNDSHAQPAPPPTYPTPQEITDAITNGIERADNKHDANHPAPPPDNSSWRFNCLLTAFTGLLVVVGAFSAFLIFFTLKATEKAANAARDAAEIAKKSLLAANRPVIVIDPLELQATPHIHFGLKNGGNGTAIIKEVTAIVMTLATPPQTNSWFVPSDANGIIEPGQPMSGYPITSPVLGTPELQQVRSGEMTLCVIFQIIFHDIFGTCYDPRLSFDFDHIREEFITRPSLIPKREQ